ALEHAHDDVDAAQDRDRAERLPNGLEAAPLKERRTEIFEAEAADADGGGRRWRGDGTERQVQDRRHHHRQQGRERRRHVAQQHEDRDGRPVGSQVRPQEPAEPAQVGHWICRRGVMRRSVTTFSAATPSARSTATYGCGGSKVGTKTPSNSSPSSSLSGRTGKPRNWPAASRAYTP